jgi:uncharacterized protein YjbI with pentapeptide repeats
MVLTSKADFSFAEMRGSNFHGSILTKANLYGADVSEGDFSQSDLRDCNMTDAKIFKADFNFAKMTGSVGTNGRPWGASIKAAAKKPWWQIWRSAAL